MIYTHSVILSVVERSVIEILNRSCTVLPKFLKNVLSEDLFPTIRVEFTSQRQVLDAADMKKEYSVYIMSSISNVLYIGVTSDLAGRVWEHKNCTYRNSYTSKNECFKLVYFEDYYQVSDAIQREKQLKGWTRKKKLWLVLEENPNLVDISLNWY